MINEIKDLLGSGKLIFGADKTIKALRNGTLNKIYLAKNTKVEIREDIEHWSKLGEISIENTSISNDELGTVCKKPFAISVIGVSKE